MWSTLIRSILRKQAADFKRFLDVLTAYLQSFDNPGLSGVFLSKTGRTKRRIEPVKCLRRTREAEHHTSVLAGYFRQHGSNPPERITRDSRICRPTRA